MPHAHPQFTRCAEATLRTSPSLSTQSKGTAAPAANGCLAAAILVSMLVFGPVNHASAWPARTAMQPLAATPSGPIDRFLQLLRMLLSYMGGSPETVPIAGDSSDAVWVVVDYFALHGTPSVPGADDAAEGRSLVQDAYDALQEVAGDVDPLAASTLESMLRAMYSDLGGNPGDLP